MPSPHKKNKAALSDSTRPSTLHVCTSCRVPGSPREPREDRAGFKLYRELQGTFLKSHLATLVRVEPVECLSLCPRPCGIALSSPGAWSYLFGDQDHRNAASDIVELASLYVRAHDGFMPREQRPKKLRASVLGRVPPSPGDE